MKIAFTYKEGNLFSKGVSAATDSKWSHCFLIVKELGDDYIIMESNFIGGVKIGLLSKYIDNPKVRYEIFEVDTEHTCLDCITPYLGTNYGYLQILGYLFFIKLLRRKINPCVDGLWCSELVLLGLLDTELHDLFSGFNRNRVTPKDIYKIASVNNKFKLVDKSDK